MPDETIGVEVASESHMEHNRPEADDGRTALGQRHMGGFGLAGISAFWLGSNVLWTALLVLLLPGQIEQMTGRHKAEALGYTIGAGALFSLFVPLIIGPISDRCASRLGRRRPFLFAGVAINVVGLFIMLYFSTSGLRTHGGAHPGLLITDELFAGLPFHYWGYVLGYAVVQVGNNIATGAYQGVIPDVVLPAQRGVASGYMGLMTQFGSVLGIVSIAIFHSNIPLCYEIMAGAIVVTMLITAVSLREVSLPEKPPPMNWGGYFRSIWRDLAGSPDFAWVWITRFLVMFGFYSVLPFVNYYLRDVIHVPRDQIEKTTGEVFILILLAAMVTGIIGGWMSDRIGRKKIVYAATAMMAIGAVCLSFCTNLSQAIMVGVFFGLGYGAYVSVDWALGTDVLPSQEEAGKDMAVWHIAMVAPQSLAAPVAGLILAAFGFTIEHVASGDDVTHYTTMGYTAMFAVTAIAFALGAVLLRNVKKAR